MGRRDSFRKKKRLRSVTEHDNEPKEEDTPLTSKVLRLATVQSGQNIEWASFGSFDSLLWTVKTKKKIVKEGIEEEEEDEDSDINNNDDDYEDDEFDESLYEEEEDVSQKEIDDVKELEKLSTEPYTLVSFGLRGEAELIRLLFVMVGEPFEDRQILEEEMADVLADLLGETNHEHLVVEATFERLCRLKRTHDAVIKSLPLEVKNKEKMEWIVHQLKYVILPTPMAEWDKLILSSTGPYIVASGMTLADIAITDFLDQCTAKIPLDDLLADFDALTDLLMLVKQQPEIAVYLDDRSDFDWNLM